jgi:hypothetical protein
MYNTTPSTHSTRRLSRLASSDSTQSIFSIDSTRNNTAIEAQNEETAAAPEEEVREEEADEKEEKSDDSDSDFVSGSESESESDIDSSNEEEEQETESIRPVSRSASIARQVALDAFITRIIDENKWSTATNWKDRELSNIIESASLKHNIRKTTADLKKLIKARVMSE